MAARRGFERTNERRMKRMPLSNDPVPRACHGQAGSVLGTQQWTKRAAPCPRGAEHLGGGDEAQAPPSPRACVPAPRGVAVTDGTRESSRLVPTDDKAPCHPGRLCWALCCPMVGAGTAQPWQEHLPSLPRKADGGRLRVRLMPCEEGARLSLLGSPSGRGRTAFIILRADAAGGPSPPRGRRLPPDSTPC